MSVLTSIPLLWAQAFLEGVPARYQPLMYWLYLLGEPKVTILPNSWTQAVLAGLITWGKVVSLFCLLGWGAFWLATALKHRTVGRGNWLDYAALAALIGVVTSVVIGSMEQSHWLGVYRIGTEKIGYIYAVRLLALASAVVLFLWLEAAIWTATRKVGTGLSFAVLIGVHLALVVGIAFGFAMRRAVNTLVAGTIQGQVTWWEGLVRGLFMSATYMGFVVLLRLLWMLLGECLAVRFRRLYAIALLSVREALRRMWAAYVVVTLFLVILAFTHWFLLPPRPAELGRLYVGTLMLLCTLLLTLMVTLMTPLSMPHDIQHYTIFTVVSKPVRRIELIWGRMLGFMAIVTVLVVVFGGISLWYLFRTVGGAIAEAKAGAKKAKQQNNLAQAKLLLDQADQLSTRMAARVPIKGSLTFLDSRGTAHSHGIDVGQEQSAREPRSHIEGATPATAIWQYGIVEDPLTPRGMRPTLLDRRIPVAQMLEAGTLEGLLDQTFTLRNTIERARQDQANPNLPASRAGKLTATITNAETELAKAQQAYNTLKAQAVSLEAKVADAEKANQTEQAEQLRKQVAALHSPPIPLQMTFNVYRTTKGQKVGEPVLAELEVTNPYTGGNYREIFTVHEYYTNKRSLPSEILAGSRGALRIEVRCDSVNQYLGMAESDLFLLAQEGNFGINFMKGLVGIWLQAMVLTAIGVFAGTFLSWPVALLATLTFFIAGEAAFNLLLEFTNQKLIGGGPFESALRMLWHENQMSDLTPTLAVVTAKSFDALVMPVMSRLVYIVPNFAALDVSNTVADGFAVSWLDLAEDFFLAIAYALPFSLCGYFILKNREVAA